jgi:SH3-like domain-containing protein
LFLSVAVVMTGSYLAISLDQSGTIVVSNTFPVRRYVGISTRNIQIGVTTCQQVIWNHATKYSGVRIIANIV